ncbi:MAG: uroporphyrinogen-III synthase [Paracoccaceae bacterium]
MPSPNPTVLLTRPNAQAQEFRALLGPEVVVVISPVMQIEHLAIPVNGDAYAVFAFASRNGVIAAAKSIDLAGRRAITVGDKTAEAAAKFGMITTSAGGTSRDLVQVTKDAKPGGKILFIRGEHSQGDVAENLNSAGIDTDSAIAYRQTPQSLSPVAQGLLCGEEPVIVPLFSARSARLLSDEAIKCRACAPLILVAISESVLAAWHGPAPAHVAVANQPTGGAMVKEILAQIDHRS